MGRPFSFAVELFWTCEVTTHNDGRASLLCSSPRDVPHVFLRRPSFVNWVFCCSRTRKELERTDRSPPSVLVHSGRSSAQSYSRSSRMILSYRWTTCGHLIFLNPITLQLILLRDSSEIWGTEPYVGADMWRCIREMVSGAGRDTAPCTALAQVFFNLGDRFLLIAKRFITVDVIHCLCMLYYVERRREECTARSLATANLRASLVPFCDCTLQYPRTIFDGRSAFV